MLFESNWCNRLVTMMSSKVALTVGYEDDKSQKTLVYTGETIVAPCKLIEDCQPTTWKLSGTPIKFSATAMPLPDSLGLEERFQTITFMKIYSCKSIDELRFEDYQYMNVNQSNKEGISSFPPNRPALATCRATSLADALTKSSSSSGCSFTKGHKQGNRQKKPSSCASSDPNYTSAIFGNDYRITTGIEVQTKDSFAFYSRKNLQLTDKKGVVQTVTGNMCTVYLYEEKREVDIPVSNVEPAEAQKGDKCKMLYGDDRTRTGSLINIDYPDAIIRMDDTDQLKIVPLNHLAKLGSIPVHSFKAPSVEKGNNYQAAFAIKSSENEMLPEQISVDSSTEVSTSMPSTSTCNFAFTPTIDFILEANIDPTEVFSPPQPPDAEKEPPSAVSVSEAPQLRDALLESIVKCMQIQNSLYRLVLIKLQAHVTVAAGKTAADFQSSASDLHEASSIKNAAGMNLNDAPGPQTTGSSTESVNSNSAKASSIEGGDACLNNAPNALCVERMDDTPGTFSIESASSIECSVESLHDTPGSSSVDNAGAILNDTPKVASVENTVESPNDIPGILLCELKQPLQALMRCSGIQRELYQRLDTVNMITELHTEGQVNMLAVQSKLETIAFKTKMECCYARNPFTSHQPKPSTSEDVVQHVSPDERSFSVGADGSASLRELPHGRGALETATGERIYSGDWCKGKRHGKGKGLILSLPGANSAPAEHGFYNGGWKDNMRHGNGQMTFSSGAVYKGQWQFDKMTGYGTLKLLDGTIQEGTWKEGTLHGCTVFTWPHGVTEYREFDAGRAQLSFRTIEKEAAENVSRMSSIRCQLLNLSECVTELKDEKLRLTEQLNAQKLEHAATASKLHTTVFEIRESYKERWERDSQKQREKLDKAAEEVSELQKELEETKGALLCQICFVNRRDCIILPCSHLLYCRKCVDEHKRKGDSRCPTCRGPINSEIRCNINHSS